MDPITLTIGLCCIISCITIPCITIPCIIYKCRTTNTIKNDLITKCDYKIGELDKELDALREKQTIQNKNSNSKNRDQIKQYTPEQQRLSNAQNQKDSVSDMKKQIELKTTEKVILIEVKELIKKYDNNTIIQQIIKNYTFDNTKLKQIKKCITDNNQTYLSRKVSAQLKTDYDETQSKKRKAEYMKTLIPKIVQQKINTINTELENIDKELDKPKKEKATQDTAFAKLDLANNKSNLDYYETSRLDYQIHDLIEDRIILQQVLTLTQSSQHCNIFAEFTGIKDMTKKYVYNNPFYQELIKQRKFEELNKYYKTEPDNLKNNYSEHTDNNERQINGQLSKADLDNLNLDHTS